MFFKQKTAYEMRISDWSSDVCSSDLMAAHAASAYAEPVKGDVAAGTVSQGTAPPGVFSRLSDSPDPITSSGETDEFVVTAERYGEAKVAAESEFDEAEIARSEEHTSALQSLMRISHAVFCLKQKITQNKS